MSFFAGFAGEFANQLARSRAEEADRAEKQSALEVGVLQHLATSPDPEIQAHAVAGLLDAAGPRRYAKGLSGFFGKMADNPALPTIRQLVGQGRQIEVPAHIPDVGAQAQPGLPAELPGRVSAEGEPLPPAASAVPFSRPAAPPPGPPDAYQPPHTITVPRQVFRTPEDQAGLTARATTRGQLEGRVDVLRGSAGGGPLTDEEESLLFPGRSLLSAGTVQGKAAPAGALDNSGRPLQAEQYYQTKADPRDPSKVTYFPTAAPASVQNQAAISARPTFQHYTGPDGKSPGVWRVYRDGSKPPEFVGYQAQRGSYLQYVDPDTQEVSYIAAPPVYVQGAPATVVGGPTPPGAGPGAAAPPPPAQPGVVGAGAPALGPAVGGHRAGGPVGAGVPPPPAAPGGKGAPHGISGGRKRTLQQTEGAFLGPDGQPQVGRAFLDPGTGKYYSTQDPSQEATGFIPGAEGAAVVQNYTTANNTLVMIHAAMKAIEDAGLTADNDPRKSAELLSRFYQGTIGNDPAGAAVASLTNLASLQGASQYVKSNSRSYQMFQQASTHLPRAIGERAAAASTLPGVGGLVTPKTAALAGGHGWDSFATMYGKLKLAEEMINQGKREVGVITGKTADRAIGAGGGATGSGTAGPAVGEERVINGQRARWDGIGWLPIAGGGR